VVHAAGVLDDGVLDALTPARVAGVLAPKAGAAVHLDELAEGRDLDGFVLFSSMAGVIGGAGQGSYVAANAGLDAVAENRRARGLAGVSVGWGLWGGAGMAGEITAARARRGGLGAMDPELAVQALGQVLDQDETAVMVADVDWAKFVPGFTASRPSPLLSGIAETRQEKEQEQEPGQGLLAGRLAGLPDADQERLILGVVCGEAAAVLGHASSEGVRPGSVFRDLGFDSLTAVEYRNRLDAATGLQLPATLIFDYPTPLALAEWLRAVISPGANASEDHAFGEAEIRRALASIPLAQLQNAGLMRPLLRLATAFQAEKATSDEEGETDLIDMLDAESLIRMARGDAGI
jgi:polyketide synthase 7